MIRFLLLLIPLLPLASAERWIPLGPKAQTPVSVHGGIINLDSNGWVTLAVRSDGTVAIWGYPSVVSSLSPPPDVAAVAVGGTQIIAMTRAGEIVVLAGPSPVPTITEPVQAIAAGADVALALLHDGTVVTWYADDGFARHETGVDHVVAITAANSQSFAVRDDGTVLTWSRSVAALPVAGLSHVRSLCVGAQGNNLALLDDGTVSAFGTWSGVTVPPGLTDIQQIALCKYDVTAAAVKSSGEMVVWGAPDNQTAWMPTGIGNVAAVFGGHQDLFVLRQEGSVVGWGFNGCGQDTVPAGMIDAVAITSGYGYHMGAIQPDASLQVWGPNEFGQTNVPADLGPVVMASTGSDFTVALLADHTIRAWGHDNLGQTDVPSELSDVTSIACGAKHTLALTSGGTVVAWGSGIQSVVPAGLGAVQAIAAGGAHSMALRTDGTVVCWGDNSAGACSVPAGLNHVIAIAAGGSHSVALRDDGRVVQWGIGSGNMASLTQVVGIAACDTGTIARLADGSVAVWNLYTPGYSVVPAGFGGVTAVAGHQYDLYALAPPVECPITVSDSTLLHDGQPHCLEASSPGDLFCNWTYDGANPFPSAVGVHPAVATIDRWAYSGAATAALHIAYLFPPIVSGPDFTHSLTPTWSWATGGGGNGTFRYAIDDPAMSAPAETVGTTYTPPPLDPGSHTLYLMERDAAGHWSEISSKTVVVDIQQPGVDLIVSPTSVLHGATFAVSVVFTEAVAGFDAGALTIGNASIQSTIAHGDQRTYLAICRAGPSGPISVSLPAGRCADLAGNPNTASATITIWSKEDQATLTSEVAPGSPGAGCGTGGLAALLAGAGGLWLFRPRRR